VLPATVTAPRSGSPPPMPKVRFFGMFGGTLSSTMRRCDLVKVKRDGFVLTADGQVWQQTDDDAEKHPVRWDQPPQACASTSVRAR
jgi:hypothetical protein